MSDGEATGGDVTDDGQRGEAEGGRTSRAFRVRGRVQGVGYRMWTRRVALELGLRGSVCNVRDGSVEVRVVGPGSAVEELARLLERGPSAARVVAVERTASELPVPASGFDIEGTR